MKRTCADQLNRSFNIQKIVIFSLFVIIASIMLSGTVSAAGLADSAWPKIGHDNMNTGQSSYNGPQTNTTKWTYTTGGDIYSSPTIASDGTIYFGSNDKNLYALNPSGALKWKYATGGDVKSSPAIASDGTIYFGSFDKNFYALKPSGALKWKYTTEGNIYSSPTIGSDGTIYTGGGNSLYSFNPNGALKWKFTTGGSVVSSPTIASDGTIYFGSNDDNLYAINPSGALKWKYATGGDVKSSPAISSDGTIYFGSFDKNFYALKPTGALKWKYKTGGTVGYERSSPAIASDGTIYFVSRDGYLYAINPSGTLKWKYETTKESSSPVIGLDGTIYAIGPLGATKVNNAPPNGFWCLYALNPNGSLKWKYTNKIPGDYPGTAYSSPAISSDGTLYLGRGHGILYAFQDPKPAALKVTSTYPSSNATGVSTTSSIIITFNKNVVASVNFSGIYIKNMVSGSTVSIASKTISNNTLTIKQTNSRKNKTQYKVYIPAGSVKDSTGNTLASAYTYTFTTA